MLRGLFPLLLLSPLTLALEARDFPVPSVDFTQLSSSVVNAHNFELLTHLQDNGIIALRNVPQYSSFRREYLRTAAACAVKAQKQDADFLQHRQLRDGTKRYTVSLESGNQLGETLEQNQNLLAICPEYVEIHAAFSALVELAIASVGTALDATQKFHIVAERGAVAMTARKLLEESVHLDHFHAYEAAEGRRRLENDSEINVADLSLELHTDNGLMIAMSAPEYFEVLSNGEVQHKDTQSQDAGLFIKIASGDIVRPVLNSDELILMLGSGIDNWIKTSPPLHSVLHGMRYPQSVSLVDGQEQGNKVLRSWFGKMVLLDAHQVMDNTGLTFGQYANQTTRYLMQEETEGFQAFGAVACPPQRRLAASGNSCALKVCSLKSSSTASDLTTSCQVTCNHNAPPDVALCEQHCDCEDSASSGTVCWMLCVENISSDVCPGEQVCNKAPTQAGQAMTCTAGTLPMSDTTDATASTSTTSTTSTTQNTTASATTTDSDLTADTEANATTPSTDDKSSPASPTTEEDAPSSTPPPTSSSSSAAQVFPVAVFANGIAVLVAAFLCIQ